MGPKHFQSPRFLLIFMKFICFLSHNIIVKIVLTYVMYNVHTYLDIFHKFESFDGISKNSEAEISYLHL